MITMADDLESEHWIPLVEFSVKKGISLSTLRRYIKANKIPWKLVEGRYLVMDDGSFTAPRNHDPKGHASLLTPFVDSSQNSIPTPHSQYGTHEDIEARLQYLQQELVNAHEEIAELQTLVAFYEEKWAKDHQTGKK
jgi:hypothetical protein